MMMMMMMKNPMTLMTCFLVFSSLGVLAYQGSFGPDDCCFGFSKRLSKDKVVSYKFTDMRCTKKGVIFTMKNGQEHCVNPSVYWVKSIIKAKDKLQAN